MTRTPLLILGLGNTLCGDDGVGIVAVERLHRDYVLPDGVYALDGGTMGLSLLPWLQDAERVILVDAILADAPPGSPVRLEGREVSHAAAHRLSVHQIGVADLLDSASLLGQSPPVMILHGVVPASMELTLDLTPEVEGAVDDLVARVVREAARLGFPLRLRQPAPVLEQTA